MWLLTIHCSFLQSPVLLLVDISEITCARLTMFPTLKTCQSTAAGAFLTCTIARWDPSYPSFHILWWAPGLISTHRKLHPCLEGWFWIVVAVDIGDAHSAPHNTYPGIALSTPSHSVSPLRASSGSLCIDTSEICVHLQNPVLER